MNDASNLVISRPVFQGLIHGSGLSEERSDASLLESKSRRYSLSTYQQFYSLEMNALKYLEIELKSSRRAACPNIPSGRTIATAPVESVTLYAT